MIIGKYELPNEEKLDRVLNGALTSKGQLTGGLTKLSDWDKKDEAEKEALILAEYDKLGGLVLKDGLKLKLGTFYNFALKSANEKNEKVVELYEEVVDGELVEVTEDEAKTLKKTRKKIDSLKKKKKAKK